MEINEIHQTLGRIQEKMDRLHRWDTQGPYRNNLCLYRMNPPLPAERIAALEECYQISLPEEYCLFLQKIGNGSTDPHFGLFPLEVSLETRLGSEKQLPEMSDYFRAPFVPPISSDKDCEYEDGWGPGLLTLNHTGCGECENLVISGTEYGHIWRGSSLLAPAYTIGALPEHRRARYGHEYFDYLLSPANKERLTFLSWYEYDLDALMHAIASENR